MILNKNLGRPVKALVSILLVATLSYFAAVIGIKLLQFIDPDELRVPATATGDIKGGGDGKKLNAKKIAELHIFGDAAEKKKVAKEPPKAKPKKVAPQTKLKLDLAGILLPTENDEGYALINNKTKKSETSVYRVGDKVVGDSVLKELYADHVIIRHNGRDESLWITLDDQGWKGVSLGFGDDYEEKYAFSEDDSSAAESPPLSTSFTRSGDARDGGGGFSATETDGDAGDESGDSEADEDAGDEGGDSAVTEATEEMAQLRQELGELNSEVIKNLQPSFRPYVVDGRLQGYLVSRDGPYRDLLLAHGLRVGDIITKVNDIPMTHSVRRQLIENKDQLIGAGNLDLHVVRGGRELPMTLRF